MSGLGCSSVARLALRIISSRPLSYFLDRKASGKDLNDEYYRFLDLVSLEEQRWPEDFLVRSAMALVLLGILRSSGYFGYIKESGEGDSYSPNELYIGSLILRHLQVCCSIRLTKKKVPIKLISNSKYLPHFMKKLPID